MRLARRRAGWALTAAGTFGLSVAAQLFPHESPAAMLPPAVLPSTAPSATDAGFARVVEIRVELAWLAEPNTFPYDMVAHSNGTSVEVGGVVPNAAAHDRALEVAREHCPQPVVDRLLIKAGSGNPPAKTGDANLCRAAGAALAKMLAGRKEPFQVAADPHGQITLLGTVPSCEEKLRISRRMSQLPGCTSVINSMVVGRVNKNGQIYTVVSLDGTRMVPGDPLDLLPPPSVAMPTSPVVVQGDGAIASSEAAVGVVSVEVPAVKSGASLTSVSAAVHVEPIQVPPPPAVASSPSLPASGPSLSPACSVAFTEPARVPPAPFPSESSGPALSMGSSVIPAEPARPMPPPAAVGGSVALSASFTLPATQPATSGAVAKASWTTAPAPAKPQTSTAPATVAKVAAPAKPQASTAAVTVTAQPAKTLPPIPAAPVIRPVPAPKIVALPVSPYGGCVPRPTANFIVAAPARPAANTSPNALPASLAAAPVVSQSVRAIPVTGNGPITLVSGTQTEGPHLALASADGPHEDSTHADHSNPEFDQPETKGKIGPKEFAAIKHLVESTSSKAPCHAELKAMGDDRVGVTLHVHSAADGQALGERILAMPELGSCKVELLIDVRP